MSSSRIILWSLAVMLGLAFIFWTWEIPMYGAPISSTSLPFPGSGPTLPGWSVGFAYLDLAALLAGGVFLVYFGARSWKEEIEAA